MPGKIAPASTDHNILGGLDLMATFASMAGIKLPVNDRADKPIVFDSYDMSPVLFGTGKSERKSWFYFTENELSPGAIRVGNYKAVFNLRGDNGVKTGGLAVDTNLGWKGAESYVAAVPQVFDLWADPQERYDIFMSNVTERTWTIVSMNAAAADLMKTYVKYPLARRKARSMTGRSPCRSTNASSTYGTAWPRKASLCQCLRGTRAAFSLRGPGRPQAIRSFHASSQLCQTPVCQIFFLFDIGDRDGKTWTT